mmetsp:Transcript_9317/g.13982  ORF Transcript_9317/g.13982 Transcript_9317/m.13982 type:complete len:447 (+) Transcript_9317:1998-3338(+)
MGDIAELEKELKRKLLLLSSPGEENDGDVSEFSVTSSSASFEKKQGMEQRKAVRIAKQISKRGKRNSGLQSFQHLKSLYLNLEVLESQKQAASDQVIEKYNNRVKAVCDTLRSIKSECNDKIKGIRGELSKVLEGKLVVVPLRIWSSRTDTIPKSSERRAKEILTDDVLSGGLMKIKDAMARASQNYAQRLDEKAKDRRKYPKDSPSRGLGTISSRSGTSSSRSGTSSSRLRNLSSRTDEKLRDRRKKGKDVTPRGLRGYNPRPDEKAKSRRKNTGSLVDLTSSPLSSARKRGKKQNKQARKVSNSTRRREAQREESAKEIRNVFPFLTVSEAKVALKRCNDSVEDTVKMLLSKDSATQEWARHVSESHKGKGSKSNHFVVARVLGAGFDWLYLAGIIDATGKAYPRMTGELGYVPMEVFKTREVKFADERTQKKVKDLTVLPNIR